MTEPANLRTALWPLCDEAARDVAPLVRLLAASGTLAEPFPTTEPVFAAGQSVVHVVGVDDGQPQPAPDQADRLIAAVEASGPRCVVLDACYDRRLAAALVVRGCHVIGVPGRLGRPDADAFVYTFLESTAAGAPYREAFDAAFEAVCGDELPELLQPVEHAPGSDEAIFRTLTAAGATDVTVWYGTNRLPDPRSDSDPYGTDSDDQVHVGRCVVRVPPDVRYGRNHRSALQRLVGQGGDYHLTEHHRLDNQPWRVELEAELRAESATNQNLLVYLHGYRARFREAAIVAAQLHIDLNFPGIPAFFSWPSMGSAHAYWSDEDALQHAERYLYEYLHELCRIPKLGRVHVIAYSMGNRGLLRVAIRAAQQAAADNVVALGQVVLAAPDVGVRFFRGEVDSLRRISEGVTLYVSTSDRVLKSSGVVHQGNRVGYAPPFIVVPGIHTINVGAIDPSLMGHGYFRSARPVLNDLSGLLAGRDDPSARPALRKDGTGDGEFWSIRP